MELTAKDNLNISTNVVISRKFILEQLGITKEKIKFVKSFRKRVLYQMIINWVMDEPLPSDSKLKEIDKYLQPYDILCELEEWEAAAKILFNRLNTPIKEELHEQLDIWGYHSIRVDLYLKLQGKLSLDLDVIILNRLGQTYLALEQYQKAEESYNKALHIANEINNPIEKLLALCGLGNIRLRQNDCHSAKTYHEESEKILCKDTNEKQKRIIFQSKGNLCQALKQHNQAINYYEMSLNISNKINDRRGAATALFSLGKNYNFIGEMEKAISFYLESLEIYYEIDDFVGQRCANYNLAQIYETKGQLHKAKFRYEQSLIVPNGLDDSFIKNDSFYRLGNICYRLGYLTEAVNNYEQYLHSIFEREIRFDVFLNLAGSYRYLGQIDKTILCYKKCLNLINNDSEKNPLIASHVFCNLSLIYNDKKEFKTAVKYSLKAIKNYQRVTNKKEVLKGKSYSLGNLGIALRGIGKYRAAIKFFNQALAIAEDLHDYSNQGVQLRDLGITYEKMGMLDKAFEYLHKSEEILNQQGLPQEKSQTIITIGKTYQKYGEYQKAKLYFNKAKY
ncbi:tetratricopeptide repeat protein [Phormidium sp. LEGE 05292]|uniref:tetratricopeptide repeat protein n=1 Tax=[Phormidium] sp. LEGE 05292 TaxID=767427 RepID=UPI00187EE3DE|nr:tetratricopeptide repeat protein [Phormidium sp. LEGE 05292]MBE9224099.1 tetratricopeptide repeat protein [Phormidium sp. LEGE 05292]